MSRRYGALHRRLPGSIVVRASAFAPRYLAGGRRGAEGYSYKCHVDPSGTDDRTPRLSWTLERFAGGGVYNLVAMNLVPTSPLYGSDADAPSSFSEEWWEMFRSVCEGARRLGIYIWFYEQIGFSGANLRADTVEERPEFAEQWLERTVREMSEPEALKCPSGGRAVATAIPIDGGGAPTGEPVHCLCKLGEVSGTEPAGTA